MDVRFLYGKRGHPSLAVEKASYLDWPVKQLRIYHRLSKNQTEIIKYSGCSSDKITVLDLPQVIEIARNRRGL
jgi:hypothetical protein